MSIDEFTNNLRSCVTEHKLSNGLNQIIARLQPIEGDKYDQAILLLNQLEELNKNNHRGVYTHEQVFQLKNKISTAYLTLVNSLESDVRVVKLFSLDEEGINTTLYETLQRDKSTQIPSLDETLKRNTTRHLIKYFRLFYL